MWGCYLSEKHQTSLLAQEQLISQGSWTSMEDYVSAPTFVWYNENSDYGWLPGHWLSALDPPGEGDMFYQDSFGVQVAGDFNPQAPAQPLPEYLDSDDGILMDDNCGTGLITSFAFLLQGEQRGQKPGEKPGESDIFLDCLKACDRLADVIRKDCWAKYDACMKKKPKATCQNELRDCRTGVGEVVMGCERRCYDLPGSPDHPWIVPPGEKIQIGVIPVSIPKGIDIPTDAYDKCYPDYEKKIPGLPKPPKKK